MQVETIKLIRHLAGQKTDKICFRHVIAEVAIVAVIGSALWGTYA